MSREAAEPVTSRNVIKRRRYAAPRPALPAPALALGGPARRARAVLSRTAPLTYRAHSIWHDPLHDLDRAGRTTR